jgi:hypothetical protein
MIKVEIFRREKMREEVKEKIHASHQLQVNLGEMRIKDDEIKEIVDEIKKIRPNVENIFLNINELTDKGALILGMELTQLVKLSGIDLQFNQIDKSGMAALFRLKVTHPNLEIDLHGNRLSDVAQVLDLETDALKNHHVK